MSEEESTPTSVKTSNGAVMDVMPPTKVAEASPVQNPVVSTGAPIEENADKLRPEAPVAIESEKSDESVAVTDSTEPKTEQTPPMAQDEKVVPQQAAEPEPTEPDQYQAAPLLAAKPKAAPKHHIRWIFVFVAIVAMGLIGIAVAAYLSTHDQVKEPTMQAGVGATTNQPLEETQSALDAANTTVDETLKNDETTELPENEFSDDQLGL